MSFRSFFKIISHTYNSINNDGFDEIDPNIIRYFRTEYGKDWKIALQHHIYNKNIENKKKAA
tara:strand:- start:166 stop:351 length:186 start_codon:yes stop_codon:yes gene_type:complete